MLSLRQLSRQLPRSVARLTSTAARQPLRTPAFAAARTAAHFSTSLLRRQGVFYRPAACPGPCLLFLSPDASTQELAAKLNSEIALEKEQQADDSYRYNCQEYIDNSEFKIEDKPGQEEVHLTRSYGDEKFDCPFLQLRHQLADMRFIASRLPSPLPISTLTTRRPTPKTLLCTAMRTVLSTWMASPEVPTPRVP